MGIPESLWISMKQPDMFHGNFRDFPSVAQVAMGLVTSNFMLDAGLDRLFVVFRVRPWLSKEV